MSPDSDELVNRNEVYATTHKPLLTIAEREAKGIFAPKTCIISCVDPRVWPEQYFNLKPGEAFVFRTIAGHPQSVFEQIIGLDRVSHHFKDLILVYHTDCGSCRFDVSQIQTEFAQDFPDALPEVASMNFGATSSSIERSLREDVKWLKDHPLMRKGLAQAIKGYLLSIKTGKVERLD